MRPDLAAVIAGGDAILFTGAGFSADARDVRGRPLPTSSQMTAELWRLCFGDEPQDDSTLCDLYDVALGRAPGLLARYLAERLTVDEASLPPHYGAWFAAPWRRVYTLNVDNLALAVSRRFRLPRPLRAFSAVDPAAPAEQAATETLEVVHLNGLVGGGAEQLMFSTFQYAARLCGRDREYDRLARDLDRSPSVLVGTTLDEAVLWQHVELNRSRTPERRAQRPPAFLVARSLSRARQALLESVGIEWIEGTTAEVAARVFGDQGSANT
jgi:hypothetical protein